VCTDCDFETDSSETLFEHAQVDSLDKKFADKIPTNTYMYDICISISGLPDDSLIFMIILVSWAKKSCTEGS
jgi:hypothetical protein